MPNVSKTIRSLERELGRPLLERSGKGVSPTVYGETVLEYAKMILKATATISSLAVPDMKNSIRISTYPSNMIARLLTDFYKEWGHVYSIEHHEGTVEDITEQVHQGISEIGIVYVAQHQVQTFQHILSHKNLEFIPLKTKKICLYVGPCHPLRMAEPSVIVTRSRFNTYFVIAHSKNTQAATDVANTIAAPNPKKYNEVNRAGMSAMHTPYIFLCTLSRPCTWGDSDTINFFAIIFLFYFVLRARMRAITVVLPIRILSNIGRVEGQVNWHEPHSMHDVMSLSSANSQLRNAEAVANK